MNYIRQPCRFIFKYHHKILYKRPSVITSLSFTPLSSSSSSFNKFYSHQKMSDNRSPIEISSNEEWDSKVIKSNNLVLVDFAAEWCGPCRMLAPILAKVMKDFPNIAYVHVDIDQMQTIASNFNITGVPTVILFKDGKKKADFVGLKNEQSVRQWLDSNK